MRGGVLFCFRCGDSATLHRGVIYCGCTYLVSEAWAQVGSAIGWLSFNLAVYP